MPMYLDDNKAAGDELNTGLSCIRSSRSFGLASLSHLPSIKRDCIGCVPYSDAVYSHCQNMIQPKIFSLGSCEGDMSEPFPARLIGAGETHENVGAIFGRQL